MVEQKLLTVLLDVYCDEAFRAGQLHSLMSDPSKALQRVRSSRIEIEQSIEQLAQPQHEPEPKPEPEQQTYSWGDVAEALPFPELPMGYRIFSTPKTVSGRIVYRAGKDGESTDSGMNWLTTRQAATAQAWALFAGELLRNNPLTSAKE